MRLDENLSASNIISGKQIFGIQGTYIPNEISELETMLFQQRADEIYGELLKNKKLVSHTVLVSFDMFMFLTKNQDHILRKSVKHMVYAPHLKKLEYITQP